MPDGFEFFERVAAARARLLRAERFGSPAQGDAGLALTFELGRITVEPEASAAGDAALSVSHPEDRDEPDSKLVSLEEEEPWWRVLGSPLTAVHWVGSAQGHRELRLRFRELDDNPRHVALQSNGRAVTARIDSAKSSVGEAGS